MIEVSVTKDRLTREGTEIRLTEAGEGQDTEDSAGQNQTQNEPSKITLKRKTWKLVDSSQVRRRVIWQLATRSPEQLIKDYIGQWSKIIKPDADSNPLDWYKIHESAYPTLAILAKKYVCVCASSCASEWLFNQHIQTCCI